MALLLPFGDRPFESYVIHYATQTSKKSLCYHHAKFPKNHAHKFTLAPAVTGEFRHSDFMRQRCRIHDAKDLMSVDVMYCRVCKSRNVSQKCH